MNRILVLSVVMALLLGLVGIAAAQEPETARPPFGYRHGGGQMMAILEAATGMDHITLMQTLREQDSSLAALIEAQGGDVEAVQGELYSLMSAHLNARFSADSELLAERLAALDSHLDSLLNTPPSEWAGAGFGMGFGGHGGPGGHMGQGYRHGGRGFRNGQPAQGTELSS